MQVTDDELCMVSSGLILHNLNYLDGKICHVLFRLIPIYTVQLPVFEIEIDEVCGDEF